jgi:hypothetical protein
MQLNRKHQSGLVVVILIAVTVFFYSISGLGPKTSGSDLQPTLMELRSTLADLKVTLQAVAGVTSMVAKSVQSLNSTMQERTGREVERDANQDKDMADLKIEIQRLTAVVDKLEQEAKWKK